MIYALYIGAMAVAAILEYSMFAFLPVLKYAMPVLVLCIFATVAHRPRVSLPVVAAGGALMDWMSAAPFGISILLMLGLWSIIIFLIRRFFTNLSLLSCMAIALFAVVYYFIGSWFVYLILNVAGIMPAIIHANMPWLSAMLWSMLLNSMLMGILFFFAHRISKVFNFAFIDKR